LKSFGKEKKRRSKIKEERKEKLIFA